MKPMAGMPPQAQAQNATYLGMPPRAQTQNAEPASQLAMQSRTPICESATSEASDAPAPAAAAVQPPPPPPPGDPRMTQSTPAPRPVGLLMGAPPPPPSAFAKAIAQQNQKAQALADKGAGYWTQRGLPGFKLTVPQDRFKERRTMQPAATVQPELTRSTPDATRATAPPIMSNAAARWSSANERESNPGTAAEQGTAGISGSSIAQGANAMYTMLSMGAAAPKGNSDQKMDYVMFM